MSYSTYLRRLKRSTRLFSCCDEDRKPLGHVDHVRRVHRSTCPWCRCTLGGVVCKNVAHLLRCFEERSATVGYKGYKHRLERCKTLFPCCERSWTASEYLNHLYESHRLRKSTDCPWCRKLYGETKGIKNNLPHLVECFAKFETRKKQKIVPCRECLAFDSTLLKGDFRGRPRIHDDAFYEPFAEKDYMLRPWFSEDAKRGTVRFDDRCGLGSDAAFFLERFQTLKTLSWYHAFVNADAFDSFYSAVMEEDSVGLLPFWCLCDGSKRSVVHHRHCILVACDGAFNRVWRKVKSGSPCKRYRLLKTVHHLANAMNYVSCTGGRDCHYFINRPFSPHARLFLKMCCPGGLQRYLTERHGDRHVYQFGSLTKRPDRQGEDKWMVKVGEYLSLGEPAYCRMPLLDGGGAHFLDSVKDDWIALSRKQQMYAEETRLQREEGEKRRLELESKDAKMEGLRNKNERLLGENVVLKNEVKHLRERIEFLLEKDEWRMEVRRILEEKYTDVVSAYKEKDEAKLEIQRVLEETVKVLREKEWLDRAGMRGILEKMIWICMSKG